MPDFWQFPTVSAWASARSTPSTRPASTATSPRAGIADTQRSRVWAFVGDGEMDEPESLGALGLAAREGLDNLIFVVNCNLQRLDGPVRGNGKIIQELEATFRGAGWHVIKVIWAREWDDLLARDIDGVLLDQDERDARRRLPEALGRRMAPTSASTSSAPIRACGRWSSTSPTTSCAKLRRGGHDYRKVYAAYAAAVAHTGAPTVILAKTVKGWTLGPGIEAPQRHPPGEEADRRTS